MRFSYKVCALLTKHGGLRPRRLSLRDRNPLRFSDGIPAVRPYFFPTAAKSRQKGPLSSKALTPIIDQIKQAAFSCSRQRKAQLAISITAPCVILPSNIHVGRLPIDLHNLTNNRRVLSRE
jgi:hypothetical protein